MTIRAENPTPMDLSIRRLAWLPNGRAASSRPRRSGACCSPHRITAMHRGCRPWVTVGGLEPKRGVDNGIDLGEDDLHRERRSAVTVFASVPGIAHHIPAEVVHDMHFRFEGARLREFVPLFRRAPRSYGIGGTVRLLRLTTSGDQPLLQCVDQAIDRVQFGLLPTDRPS
jgi:hypothetical protein